MKKILISTIVPVALLTNYGSFMQHYCLRMFLKQKGFIPVRYRIDDYIETSLLRWWRRIFLDLTRKAIWWFTPNKKLSYGRDEWLYFSRTVNRFRKSYRKHIGSLRESYADGEVVGCIMGSDQVMTRDARCWFSLINESVPRIIYAGSTDWWCQSHSKEWLRLAREMLPSFQRVGLRERIGCDICKALVTDKDKVSRVLDPVLLVDHEVVRAIECKKKIFSAPTMFCYFVNIRRKEDLDVVNLENIASSMNCDLKILGIQGAGGYIPMKYRLELSVEEFLGAIRDAKYIITNSFHGIALSVQYAKRFIVERQIDIPGINQNTRQEDILRMLGLSAVMVSGFDCDEACTLLSNEYNYDDIKRVLALNQKISREWLISSLSTMIGAD